MFRIEAWQVISGMVQCTDTVFDVYKKGYRIKEMRKKTQKDQGVIRLSINMSTLVFKKTNEIMTINENKWNCSSLLQANSRDFSQRAEKLAIAKEQNVIINYDEDTQSLQPCDKEEIYAKEMSKTRLKKLIIPAIDADAIEIVSYVCLDLGVDEQ